MTAARLRRVGSGGDPRLPAAVAVAISVTLYATLPSRFTVGPSWLLPALEGVVFVVLVAGSPYRETRHAWLKGTAIFGIGLINLANIGSLVLLTHGLLHGSKATGSSIFFAAVQIWLTNVLVYALWFWELDGRGPIRRHSGFRPDFLFPQQATPELGMTDWVPGFLDYLYLAFTNATAFSPTDAMPLAAWAKALMTSESIVSLLTVTIVAARAVNILH